MPTYNTKVYIEQGGEKLVVKDGGSVDLGANVTLTVNGTNIVITGLPTTNPGAGALYANSNVLTLGTA